MGWACKDKTFLEQGVRVTYRYISLIQTWFIPPGAGTDVTHNSQKRDLAKASLQNQVSIRQTNSCFGEPIRRFQS